MLFIIGVIIMNTIINMIKGMIEARRVLMSSWPAVVVAYGVTLIWPG